MAKKRQRRSADFKFRVALESVKEQTAREAELFEQIGRLQMELAWLKKT